MTFKIEQERRSRTSGISTATPKNENHLYTKLLAAGVLAIILYLLIHGPVTRIAGVKVN